MRHLAASTRSSISTATAVKASCRARCRMTSVHAGRASVMTLPRDLHSRTCVMRTVCEAARARSAALSLPCGLGLVREGSPRSCSAAGGHRRRRGPRLRLRRSNWHWLVPTLHEDSNPPLMAFVSVSVAAMTSGGAPVVWAQLLLPGPWAAEAAEACAGRRAALVTRQCARSPAERVGKRTAVPIPLATPPASRSSSAYDRNDTVNNTSERDDTSLCSSILGHTLRTRAATMRSA